MQVCGPGLHKMSVLCVFTLLVVFSAKLIRSVECQVDLAITAGTSRYTILPCTRRGGASLGKGSRSSAKSKSDSSKSNSSDSGANNGLTKGIALKRTAAEGTQQVVSETTAGANGDGSCRDAKAAVAAASSAVLSPRNPPEQTTPREQPQTPESFSARSCVPIGAAADSRRSSQKSQGQSQGQSHAGGRRSTSRRPASASKRGLEMGSPIQLSMVIKAN